MPPIRIDQWLEAETALGFRTFYPVHLHGVQKLTVIHGPHNQILNRMAETYAEDGIPVVCWHSVYRPHHIQGIHLPLQQAAWISGELYRTIPMASRMRVDHILLGPDTAFSSDIETLKTRIRKLLSAAHTAFEEHERLITTIPINLTEIRQHLVQKFFGDRVPAHDGYDHHFFGSPLTGLGPDSTFVNRAFEPLKHTVHIRGPLAGPITGLIRRIGEMALIRGYHVEFYHDALNPARIDHVLIPQISLGLTHSCAPHQILEEKNAMVLSLGDAQVFPEAEEWRHAFQQYYSQAWRLMEQIVFMSGPDVDIDCDLPAIVSRTTEELARLP